MSAKARLTQKLGASSPGPVWQDHFPIIQQAAAGDVSLCEALLHVPSLIDLRGVAGAAAEIGAGAGTAG